MAYLPTNYRDNDPSTPLSAANLNNTERGVKSAHDQIVALRAEIRDIDTSGVDEAQVRAIIDDVLAGRPVPAGWVFSPTGQPPTDGVFTEGTFCFTMESGRVFRRENNQWVYKGFISTAVQDQAIAHQVLSGKYTQSALTEVTGVSIPFMDDYNRPRLQFAGRDWVARGAWKTGGPMANDQWDTNNVTITPEGKAILKLTPQIEVTPDTTLPAYGAELVSVNTMGYGIYEIAFTADFNLFDKWATFGVFLFDWDDDIPGHGEIDLVEIGRWGQTNLVAKLTHYPDDDPVHSPEFTWPTNLTKGIVRLAYEPGRLTWTLIDGNTRETLHTATTTERVPSHRRQKVHINLWAFNSSGWQSVAEHTVTIDSFSYIKHTTQAGGGLDVQEVDQRINTAVAQVNQTTDSKISTAVAKVNQTTDTKISNALAGFTPTGGTLFDRIYEPGRRYLTIPTYWWADSDWNTNSNWQFVFKNLDLVPFTLMNPRSGAGDKVEQDFLRHVNRMKSLNKPVIAYVRTVTDLANRVMRPTNDIHAEIARYVQFYGRENIQGVFLDEVHNGWDTQYDNQKDVYLGIFRQVRQTYGDDFLIVVNPGSPTTSYLVDDVDVIMCFEQNPKTFLNHLTGLNPDWYRTINPGKLWVAIHDVASESEARQILAELEKLNIANVYLTTDTFNGVIGGENESNNPWDNLPERWLVELQTDWMRHTLQPIGVRNYTTNSSGGVQIVASAAEAAQLPLGTIYAIVQAKTPDVVGTTGGNLNAESFTVNINNAQAGDKIIIGVNTRAVSSMTVTPPAGFTTAVDGYWAGTQRFWLFTGDYTDGMTVTASQSAEYGWAAVAVRDASTVLVGDVKTREEAPQDEATVVTAPAMGSAQGDLVLGFAFERTSATETANQINVNDGWTKLHVTEQSTNYQTALIAKGGVGDMVVTYPNPQAVNAGGVQVICRG